MTSALHKAPWENSSEWQQQKQSNSKGGGSAETTSGLGAEHRMSSASSSCSSASAASGEHAAACMWGGGGPRPVAEALEDDNMNVVAGAAVVTPAGAAAATSAAAAAALSRVDTTTLTHSDTNDADLSVQPAPHQPEWDIEDGPWYLRWYWELEEWWYEEDHAIQPRAKWYTAFWLVTIVTALINAILEPYKLAFTNSEALTAANGFWTATEIICTLVFVVDIVLKFFLAFKEPDSNDMVTDLSRIAQRYLRGMFIFDVLFTFPFAAVILTARPDLDALTHLAPYNSSLAGNATNSSSYDSSYDPNAPLVTASAGLSTALFVALLVLLKLGPLYRLPDLFSYLDYQMILGQAQLMILRNLTYIMLQCHIFACIFYWVARAENFDSQSWVGSSYQRFDGQPHYVIYMNSMYLAIVVFSGLGDATFFPHSPIETLFFGIFCLLNVFMAAYILGTVTMLMVKADEKSGIFRGHMSMLMSYSRHNELPEELEDGMKQHLEMHFLNEQASDAKLLAVYPPAIKRRVLRHMYEVPLRNCSLFSSLKPKFLDALMASCKTDMFLPHVQLVTEGDIVSDLYMVVAGTVAVMQKFDENSNSRRGPSGSLGGGGSASFSAIRSQSLLEAMNGTGGQSMKGAASAEPGAGQLSGEADRSLIMNAGMSMSAGSHRAPNQAAFLSTSECFGAVSFFTETPSTETIWTCTHVKVLMISHATYEALQNTHPRQVMTIIGNVRAQYEKELLEELQPEVESLDRASSTYSELLPYMIDGRLKTTDLPTEIMTDLQEMLTPSKKQLVEKLEMIKSLIRTFNAKREQHRTIEMLDAASKGDEDIVRRLLASGVSANSADYDKRTALMVCSQEGRDVVVKMLVNAGADVHAQDIFGTNALVGAIKAGHDKTVDILLAAGGTLAECTSVVRPKVIDAIMRKDTNTLGRYLQAGTDPNLPDHNKSTLLHLAAGQRSLKAVELLLCYGADVTLTNRWGECAADDARKAGSAELVALLTKRMEEVKNGIPPSQAPLNARDLLANSSISSDRASDAAKLEAQSSAARRWKGKRSSLILSNNGRQAPGDGRAAKSPLPGAANPGLGSQSSSRNASRNERVGGGSNSGAAAAAAAAGAAPVALSPRPSQQQWLRPDPKAGPHDATANGGTPALLTPLQYLTPPEGSAEPRVGAKRSDDGVVRGSGAAAAAMAAAASARAPSVLKQAPASLLADPSGDSVETFHI